MIHAKVDIGQSEISLQKAILLYGQPPSPHSSASISYASLHRITIMDGRPVVEAGEPITREGIRSALVDLNGVAPLELLNDHILAFNGMTLVFWAPPQRRKVWFDCDEPMGKRFGVTPHPGLIFVVTDELHVYAVKGADRPQADTEIFSGPYLNTYKGGNICMGNVRIPKAHPSQILSVTKAFFQSVFTHTNNPRIVKYEGGIYSLWNDLLDGKYKKFPDEVLLQGDSLPGKTLSQLLGHFANTRNSGTYWR